MNDVAAVRGTYQFHVVLRDTSPRLWRRLQVNSNISVADFHRVLEVALSPSISRPYRFLIRGRTYGINSLGGQADRDRPRLADVHFLPKERFPYEYDVDCNGRPRWRHQVRFERALPVEPRRLYPVCRWRGGGAAGEPR